MKQEGRRGIKREKMKEKRERTTHPQPSSSARRDVKRTAQPADKPDLSALTSVMDYGLDSYAFGPRETQIKPHGQQVCSSHHQPDDTSSDPGGSASASAPTQQAALEPEADTPGGATGSGHTYDMRQDRKPPVCYPNISDPMVEVMGPDGGNLVFRAWTPQNIEEDAKSLPDPTLCGENFVAAFTDFCKELRPTGAEICRVLARKLTATDLAKIYDKLPGDHVDN
ncbi:uncharacterized protein LOC118565518 [Fundulus heteroclitus]|uniref:uncharacterized protein LOC118565518 n=1 Tax=Fundulus heteroclitus TaxID=8078 RepID=UPI00165B13CE|nr:uncharacterized protein LOC118565518 [Fundulus heteroclitus]